MSQPLSNLFRITLVWNHWESCLLNFGFRKISSQQHVSENSLVSCMGSSPRRLSGNIGNSRLPNNFVELGFACAKALSNLWLTVPAHAIIQSLYFLLSFCTRSGWGSRISTVNPSSSCVIRDLTQRMSWKVSFCYVRVLKVTDSVSFGFIKWMPCGELCVYDSLAIRMFYFRSNSSCIDTIW
jgi:hypothetical protein